jgi:two-component system, sensor histidine kinase and response regulator
MGLTDFEGVDWEVLFNEFPRGIGVLDRTGRPLYGNARLLDLFAVESDALQIKHRPATYLWDPFFRSFLANKELHEKIRIPIPSQTGEKKWHAFFLIRSNENSQIFLFEDDITQQHQKEVSLKNARNDAEKATKTKSSFLANMSHEIRTPIHTIIGMAELMDTTALDEEQKEYSSQIRFSADVLLSLINDILDFSKIEAGQMELEYTECNLQDLVEDTIDLVALEAHKKGVEVGFFADPAIDLHVLGDPVRIRQVLMNLVNNAVKFTDSGQIMVYLCSVKQNSQESAIKFIVEDSGIGIPEEMQSKLFDAFTQADSSTTRRFGGTGLGLTICRNLVSRMGGTLEVQSMEGLGSKFFFTLSFSRFLPERESGEKDVFGDDLEGRSILLVDDNPKIRKILAGYFTEWGCLVEEASSGREAYRKMDEKAADSGAVYDICITDQLMPDIDGWQLASQVRAHSGLTETAMILMSLKAKGTEEAKMKLLGWFSAYITKPIRKKDLWDKCIQALFPDKSEPGELEELDEMERAHENSGISGDENRTAALPGKVLVAEDHPVNRALFESILLKMGMQVVLAENGEDALEKTENERPGLIFMDCQMPVMNGYEATRRIREKGIQTPIIAVTANAMKGEREKCLECGMTDFLPKPFKNKDILPLLQKWLGPNQLEEDDMIEELEEAEELEALEKPPLPVFDFEQALDTFMGDSNLLLSLLEPFKKQTEKHISQLENPEVFSNMEEVRSIGHAIKGSSQNLSMKMLGSAAEELEQAGKEERTENAAQALQKLKAAFSEVKEGMKYYLPK